jgi:hypothetical protein
MELLSMDKKYLVEGCLLTEALLSRCKDKNAELQSTITAQEDIIKLLKEDAERLAKTLDGNGYCCEPHNRWLELQEDEDSHTNDCPITLHTQLMNELGEKQ